MFFIGFDFFEHMLHPISELPNNIYDRWPLNKDNKKIYSHESSPQFLKILIWKKNGEVRAENFQKNLIYSTQPDVWSVKISKFFTFLFQSYRV